MTTLLVTADEAFEKRLRAAAPALAANGLRRIKKEYINAPSSELVARAGAAGVSVVCLGPGLPDDAVLELARAFDRDHPEVCVLVLAKPTPGLAQQAMRAGVRDVLAPGTPPLEIARALAEAGQTAVRRRSRVAAQSDQPSVMGKVVTVLAAKGGSGKTVTATNLAVGLARAGTEVAVVDLDVHFGDVAAALQLDPEHTLADVAAGQEPVDKTVLKVFLTPHPSGLFALCAPRSPAEGDEVKPEHVGHVLGLLRQEFAVVVVDTAAGLDELALAAIEASTDLVLLCTTDVASVRSLRKEIDVLDQLGMNHQRRCFVLNRAGARVGLHADDIESVVGMKVELALPSSRAVPLSMNVGVPVVESEPRSKVARQLRQLADRFAVRTSASPAGGRNLLGRKRREHREAE